MERVEVINTDTGETTVFPCNKWLSKKKEDGEIARDLYPLIDEREARRKESRSPRRAESNYRDDNYYDEPIPNSKRRGGGGGGYEDELAAERNAGRRDRWRNEY